MAKRTKTCHGAAKSATKGKSVIFQFDNIPENVVFMILQLLSLRDAARASILAQKWLHAWRFYPNLEFTTKSLGLNKRVQKTRRKPKFISCVNSIIRNHAGTGVESFIIKRNLNNQKYAHYLDRWIYFAISSGAKELTLDLHPRLYHHYDFQYSFPSSNVAAPEPTSIEHLKLCFCYLRPSPTFIGLSNLKTLDLCFVCITREDLESLLSCTLALQQLKLKSCQSLDYLKISDVLAKLIYIDINSCWGLKTLEIHAQNLVAINTYYVDGLKVVLSEASPLKEARFEFVGPSDVIEYAFTELAPQMPNLEKLFLIGCTEMIIYRKHPRNRFHGLKHLELKLYDTSRKYDLLCVASFLDAATVLEALVMQLYYLDELFYIGKEADLRRLEKRGLHRNLRLAKMTGFSGGPSCIELALHILENSTAFEHLILDPRPDRSVWGSGFGDVFYAQCLRGHDFTISRYVRNAIPHHVKLSYS